MLGLSDGARHKGFDKFVVNSGKLLAVTSEEDILAEYRGTPIAQLLKYHCLDIPFAEHQRAELLIGMCMDNRKHLRIPENFAFILRSGGGNLRYSEFKVSWAIAIGGISSIALIGHTNCGMVDLMSRKNDFINGLVEEAGWDAKNAEDHFRHYAPIYEIGNEIDFVSSEAKRLRLRYPKILIAPLMYRVEDNLLYQLG